MTLEALYKFLNKIWDESGIPSEWRKGVHNGQLTQPVKMFTGVRQGCLVSPLFAPCRS